MNSRSPCCYVVVAVVVGIVGIVIGIVIGRFAICDESDESPLPSDPGILSRYIQEADQNIADLLINTIDNVNIENNLRNITVKPHIAGSQADFELVTYLKKTFKGYGLDSVKSAPYNVLLSYPEYNDSNSVQLLNNSEVIFDSLDAESNITYEPGVVPPFNAYSPAKEETGDLIYVNYGRVEDYEYLTHNRSINVSGKIVISRYGKIFRGSKVDIATRHGARGIIIYSDPKDYTFPEEDSRVFPDTIWLPPTAAQRGSVLVSGSGDPLTPGYPATATTFRYEENDTNVNLPTIPFHPIGYAAAEPFLRDLEGEEVPEAWRGGLDITYRFGPLKNGRQVKMNITNRNSIRRVDTIIGIIKGAVEPDRYVMLGNHRDAWVNGAIDPSSGTAVMMEVARAMAQLVKEGKWRPRRSIMFCSWGAEEYGLIGSTEWVEVPNPNPSEIEEGRNTVYDTWKHAFPWRNYSIPKIGPLGSGSDYAPILQIAGITSVDMTYSFNSNKYKMSSYPLYHTEYETFDMVKSLVDHDFKHHQAVGRVAGEMLRSMADSLIIPFNVSDYVWNLELNRQQLDKDYGDMMRQNGVNFTDLEEAVQGFDEDVTNFEQTVQNTDKKDPMAIRMVNDQLVLLEKAFLDPTGLPDRPLKKHLLFAENSNNIYAGSSFPGLVDLMFGIQDLQGDQREERWDKVRHHFSVIVNAIQAAGFTLRDVINFVEERY